MGSLWACKSDDGCRPDGALWHDSAGLPEGEDEDERDRKRGHGVPLVPPMPPVLPLSHPGDPDGRRGEEASRPCYLPCRPSDETEIESPRATRPKGEKHAAGSCRLA